MRESSIGGVLCDHACGFVPILFWQVKIFRCQVEFDRFPQSGGMIDQQQLAFYEYQYGVVENAGAANVTVLCGAMPSRLLAGDGPELFGDWLLPKCDMQFSEPDMYEHLLMSTYLWGPYSLSPGGTHTTGVPVVPPEAVKCVVDASGAAVDSAVDPLLLGNKAVEEASEDTFQDVPRVAPSPDRLGRPETTADEAAQKTPRCAHCQSDKTSLWRRHKGRLVCNACALYEKLHGVPRPKHLLNHAIKRRNRSDRCRRS